MISVWSCLLACGLDNLGIVIKIMIYRKYLNIMKGYKFQRAFVLILGGPYIFQECNVSMAGLTTFNKKNVQNMLLELYRNGFEIASEIF